MSARVSIASAYDEVANWYDSWEWQNFWDRNEVPLVRAELLRVDLPARAIDLGVGTGRYISELRSHGVDTFGIDLSPEMVSIAAGKINDIDRLIVGDLRSGATTLGLFQLAVAARVFCHVENVAEAFLAAAGLVAQGGRLIVTELYIGHNFERTRIPTPAGKLSIETWKRSVGELIEAAESAGWSLDRMVQTAAVDCSWLPEEAKLSSIDRTSDRPIFNLLSFSRT